MSIAIVKISVCPTLSANQGRYIKKKLRIAEERRFGHIATPIVSICNDTANNWASFFHVLT